ncbi:GmrSD restriction endonuclease domain-containing protein [Azohydromonas lata]|uniref:GmrSD restriction endonuclease domain-containing protein n=1 Tax=Azohydromonas lata TaxID=45677 RepID=UPI00082D8F89|nr:DUF4357 domain-containing protein [Azohydromonas lata]
MSYTLTAKEKPLAKIFSADYVFTIPGYQRPYSWGIEQAKELLEDLLGYMQDNGAPSNTSAPYFLGSIVLIKDEHSADATVVDGQQRLTTLTLLLSAIRASIKDSTAQNSITKCIYEHGDDIFGNHACYRLSLRERDRDFFRDYVQHEDGISKLVTFEGILSDPQNRLRTNARYFMDTLRVLDQKTLASLTKFIVTRCYLVTVSTPDLDSAFRIFGILNSRGLDLSATDILKAEIIGFITEDGRKVYTDKWESIEEKLGRDDFGDLFSHIRMIYRRAKPKNNLLKEFRDHVDISQPVDFISQVLMPASEAYLAIVNANHASTKHAEQINEHFSWLNRIEFKDWLPPALAFFMKHRHDSEAMLVFFRDLERLTYSMLVRKTGINDRIERFSSLTGAIEKNTDLQADTSPLQLTPEDQHATYEMLSGPLYETHSARALAVILLRLDRLLADTGASYDDKVVSVEHVLPQSPPQSSQWLQWVSDPADRLYWTHRLGNLTLLSRRKNSAASNYEFEKKKNTYFAKGGICPFMLTVQVLQQHEWSQDVMEARHAQLLAVLEEHWKLEDRQSPNAWAERELIDLTGTDDLPVFELKNPKTGLKTFAREIAGKFVVQAGSQARRKWIGQDHSYRQLHASLIEDKTLRDTGGDYLEFAANYSFKSPSAASAVSLGRPDQGTTSWCLQGTGITYAAWKKSQGATASKAAP